MEDIDMSNGYACTWSRTWVSYGICVVTFVNFTTTISSVKKKCWKTIKWEVKLEEIMLH